ncbi:MAG: c-type cytochrome [Lutibacter sp.]|jgi:mono/diheme cytochrome c family protein
MKKLFIFAILSSSLLFINCGTKEKQEKTDTLNDSIVTETVVTEPINAPENAIIEEEIPAQVKKTTTVVTTKEPGKTVTQKTTETKVNKDTKVEVETKVVVTEQPKKVVEAETPVKVVVKEPAAPSSTPVSTNEWIVPAKYLTMKNPVEANKANLALGKNLYAKHCKSCHGSTGLGDGTKAKDMKGDLGDFSSKKFQTQTDGALFYKSYIGRKDMPNYEKKIPEIDDVWAIILYMRTLKK